MMNRPQTGSENGMIGGMFGLEPETKLEPTFSLARPQILSRHHLRLVTARAALTLLTRTLQPKVAWLPSYLCDVLFDAIEKTGPEIRFYEVSEDLQISNQSWLAEVHHGDLVVFIDYFGFNLWDCYGRKAKERKAWVMEDACQAMLNARFSEHADYVIASPRKFLGIPDGGVLLAQNGASLPSGSLPPPPTEWRVDALRASQLRAEFDRYGGDRQWFELFRKIDSHAPTEPARMSDLSSGLLEGAIDYVGIANKRRRNFEQLAGNLAQFSLFDALPVDVVPLGFPVRIHNRDQVRAGLFTKEIFPPVHWPIQNSVPKNFEASHRLSQQIMTLPCDQRYSSDDMAQICQSFLSFDPVPAINYEPID